jgi:hypothetical protein
LFADKRFIFFEEKDETLIRKQKNSKKVNFLILFFSLKKLFFFLKKPSKNYKNNLKNYRFLFKKFINF